MGIRFDEIQIGMTLYRPFRTSNVVSMRRPAPGFEKLEVLSKDEYGCQVVIGGHARSYLRRDEVQSLNRNPPKAKKTAPRPRALARVGRRSH